MFYLRSHSLLPHVFTVFLLSVSLELAYATPHSISPLPGATIPLVRRSHPARTVEEWGQWARKNKERLVTKYGGFLNQTEKRSSGTNSLVNQDFDSSFYGSIAIGTPAVSYNVILDTGSSDLWVADSSCTEGCQGITTFDSSSSSTYSSKNQTFSITYGSGAAQGTLGQDVVQMAGFSVNNQVFATCDSVSADLLNSPVSGLMGLAFSTIASSGATPFWETLAQSGSWDQSLMAFQLTRFINDTQASKNEFGGSFTMGGVDSTLFTGDIEYFDIPSGLETYWVQTVSAVTVQGNSISLGSGSDLLAAIDTGTTLVGGPVNVIQEFYAQIPNSQPGTGNFEGYYTFPCSTNLEITMSFGGTAWGISSADMIVGQLNKDQCLGAFFELSAGSSAPAWIVGDTFLKNVYSVFRFNPPSVGFAQLSAKAIANSNGDVPVPSATIGSAASVVTATGVARDSSPNNGALSLSSGGIWMTFCIVLVMSYLGRIF